MLKIKFFSYIAYLMVSLYLEATYAKRLEEQRKEFERCEEDYRVLFEWEDVDNAKDGKERSRTAGNTDRAEGRTRDGVGRGDPAGSRATRRLGGSGGGSPAVQAEHDAPEGSGQSDDAESEDMGGADLKTKEAY